MSKQLVMKGRQSIKHVAQSQQTIKSFERTQFLSIEMYTTWLEENDGLHQSVCQDERPINHVVFRIRHKHTMIGVLYQDPCPILSYAKYVTCNVLSLYLCTFFASKFKQVLILFKISNSAWIFEACEFWKFHQKCWFKWRKWKNYYFLMQMRKISWMLWIL